MRLDSILLLVHDINIIFVDEGEWKTNFIFIPKREKKKNKHFPLLYFIRIYKSLSFLCLEQYWTTINIKTNSWNWKPYRLQPHIISMIPKESDGWKISSRNSKIAILAWVRTNPIGWQLQIPGIPATHHQFMDKWSVQYIKDFSGFFFLLAKGQIILLKFGVFEFYIINFKFWICLLKLYSIYISNLSIYIFY